MKQTIYKTTLVLLLPYNPDEFEDLEASDVVRDAEQGEGYVVSQETVVADEEYVRQHTGEFFAWELGDLPDEDYDLWEEEE